MHFLPTEVISAMCDFELEVAAWKRPPRRLHATNRTRTCDFGIVWKTGETNVSVVDSTQYDLFCESVVRCVSDSNEFDIRVQHDGTVGALVSVVEARIAGRQNPFVVVDEREYAISFRTFMADFWFRWDIRKRLESEGATVPVILRQAA